MIKMNGSYPENLSMVFQLSGFLIELKIKYYGTVYPDKSEAELTEIVFQELVAVKEKELADAAR